MKKNLFILIPAFIIVWCFAACTKEDTQATSYPIEGKWKGSYLFNSGGAANYFLLDFKSGGVLAVEANSTTSPELATGTYTVSGDSVKGTFIYTVGIGVNYKFAGKYTSSSNVINGTIGISPSYTDNASFTVTKQ